MKGKQEGPVHEYLFWDGNENTWAVRNGPWKVIRSRSGNIELYNLDQDISETNDLSEQYPDIANHLVSKYVYYMFSNESPTYSIV